MNGLWKYFILGFAVTALPSSIMAFTTKTNKPEVLSNVIMSEPSPSTSPTPSQTPTPTTTKPTPTPTPTPTPSLVPTPTPISSEQINALIERFAAQYVVDPNVLRHIAICESGFNPSAVNGSYVGLYQFGPITWATNRIPIGENPDPSLRFNAEESIQTAAYMLQTKGRGFWPNCQP